MPINKPKEYKFNPPSPWMSHEIVAKVVVDIFKEFGDEFVFHLIDPVILNSYIHDVKSKV